MPETLRAVLAGPVVFMGVDPNYALGPEEWLPRYRVVCRHETRVLPLLEAAGVEVFCLERAIGQDSLPGRATAGLARHARVQEYLYGLARREGPLSILLFKPSAQVEVLAQERGWRVLGAPARVARPLENKVNFFRLLDEMNLPHPRWEEVDVARVGYAEVARRLGSRLIVQGAHGFSGNRTFAVNDAESYARVAERLRQRRARVAETVPGLPVTLNACVDDQRVVVGRLFHQVTGVPECTVYPLGACGNDWAAAPLSETVQAQAAGIARAIGSTIRERGFRGIYGLDFMVTPDDKVVSIEINPRLISSVPMYTRLQKARDEQPLLVRHLLATAGARCPADGDPSRPLLGSQMVLHNLRDGGARVHGDVAAGIHVLRDGALKFVRPSFRVDDCAEREEFLVLPPASGHTLSAAGECARVQMRRASLEFPQAHEMGVLNGEARAVAHAVYAALDLRAAEGGDNEDDD